MLSRRRLRWLYLCDFRMIGCSSYRNTKIIIFQKKLSPAKIISDLLESEGEFKARCSVSASRRNGHRCADDLQHSQFALFGSCLLFESDFAALTLPLTDADGTDESVHYSFTRHSYVCTIATDVPITKADWLIIECVNQIFRLISSLIFLDCYHLNNFISI